MAASINSTVGSASANSYLTISDASAIADTMLGTLAWTSATTDQRTRALITATNGLETLQWIGERVTETQALSWPRSGAACGDKSYDDDEIPREVELATFDLAEALLSDPGLLRSPAGGGGELVPGVPNRDLSRLKLDVMELEWRVDQAASTTKPPNPLTVLPHLTSILGCLTLSSPRSGLGALIGVQRS